MVSASVASSNSPALAPDSRIDAYSSAWRSKYDAVRIPKTGLEPVKRVELVEQPALRIVGARRDPEVDREPELLRVTVDPAHRRGAALGEALNRPARDLDQELVEVG